MKNLLLLTTVPILLLWQILEQLNSDEFKGVKDLTKMIIDYYRGNLDGVSKKVTKSFGVSSCI